MSAVGDAFSRAATQDRAALVGYLPAGFPTVAGGIEAALAMAAAGADIIEVGLPYSDPLIDGPVIQEAVHRALTGGAHVTDTLRTVEAVAAAGVPTLVMTYWNPVEQYGAEAFARDLAAAGGSGMITPDLTPEEAGPWLAAAAAHRLDPVFLVAPSSPAERIELITSGDELGATRKTGSRPCSAAASSHGPASSGVRSGVISPLPPAPARSRANAATP